MYDVNPLGPIMHLKELDRQATPKLRPVVNARQDVVGVAALFAAVLLFLRLRAIRTRRRSKDGDRHANYPALG